MILGKCNFILKLMISKRFGCQLKIKTVGMKVREPFDREYGMREFHIILPHTRTLIFIGQVIK